MKVKWVVIGSTGMAGKKVVPDGILAADNCELACIHGRNEDRLRSCAEKWGVSYCLSIEAMLKKYECSAVYIASPQNLHLEHTRLCAQAGKHILCEKPLARSRAEAAEMLRLCKDYGVKLGTAFNLRFHSLHAKAKELIAGGMIGNVVSARCQYGQNYPPDSRAFRQSAEVAGGGSMIDMGNHAMDLIEYVTGKAAISVAAIAQNVVYDYEVEDACGALLEFSGGGFAFVDTYYCLPISKLRNDLEVNGTKGTLFTIDTLRGMVTRGRLLVDAEDLHQEYVFNGTDMYRAEIEAFADSIIHNRRPPCDGTDGLHSQILLDAVYASARTGQRTPVS